MLLVLIRGHGDVAVVLLEAREELADLVCRSLAVVIKADDKVPRAVAYARHERCVLAEVLCKVDGGDASVGERERGDDLKGIIRGAVVDQNYLIIILRERRHSIADLVHDNAYRVRGAVAGDHERYLFHLPLLSESMDMNTTSRNSPSSLTMSRNTPSVAKPAFS